MNSPPTTGNSCARCVELERRITALEKRVEKLLFEPESERRQNKRQAAPFSKGPPSVEPKQIEQIGAAADRQIGAKSVPSTYCHSMLAGLLKIGLA